MAKRQLLNVLANFAGVAAGLVFPLLFNIAYYRLLGTEGYGLIRLLRIAGDARISARSRVEPDDLTRNRPRGDRP